MVRERFTPVRRPEKAVIQQPADSFAPLDDMRIERVKHLGSLRAVKKESAAPYEFLAPEEDQGPLFTTNELKELASEKTAETLSQRLDSIMATIAQVRLTAAQGARGFLETLGARFRKNATETFTILRSKIEARLSKEKGQRGEATALVSERLSVAQEESRELFERRLLAEAQYRLAKQGAVDDYLNTLKQTDTTENVFDDQALNKLESWSDFDEAQAAK